MYTIVTTWNSTAPEDILEEDFSSIERRGYNVADVGLTGQFAMKISEGIIKLLSVSDIADRKCPERRDLYLRKGVKRLTTSEINKIQEKSWGRAAGNLVEKYIEGIIRDKHKGMKNAEYKMVRDASRDYNDDFQKSNQEDVKKIEKLEHSSFGIREGDTNWLLKLLLFNSGIELNAKTLHDIMKDDILIRPEDIRRIEINPNKEQIGINAPVIPDFVVPDLKIVGDIKTAPAFQSYYQLTCAGYALAYENEHGPGHDINWGIILFIPNRIPTAMVRLLTASQLYVFPISEELRNWFLSERDKAYYQLSQDRIPVFSLSERDKEKYCRYCRFLKYCVQQGLRI